MATETELAYAAGIIDGEGCIGIWKYRQPRCQHGYTYALRVTVTMTEPEVPTWLFETFGGCLNDYPPEREEWKRKYIWAISTKQARPFLGTILPYLKEKVEQAEIAIEFQSTKKMGDYRNKPKTDAVLEAEEILAVKLRNLRNTKAD